MSAIQNNRRSFLKNASLLASGILFAPLAGYSRTNNQETFKNWISILEYARWAPSPHNMQPWKVELISATKAKLYYDTSRLLTAGDPSFKFMTLGMGIFMEYMNITANSLNLKLVHSGKLNIIEPSGDISFFCDLELQALQNPKNFDPKWILSRKTSRLNYNNEAVPAYFMDTLIKEAKQAGHTLDYSNNDTITDWMMDLNKRALFQDLNNEAVRKELDGLFRYSSKEAKQHKDGLSASCMGFPGSLLHSVMNHHEKWSKGFRGNMLGKLYQSSFGGSKTIAWIRGQWDTADDLVNAGKLMGRLWIRLEQSGYVMQPMGSLITNPVAHKEISRKFQIDESNETLWLMLRIGKSDEAPRSLRLDHQDIQYKKDTYTIH